MSHVSDVFSSVNTEDVRFLMSWIQTRYGIDPACFAGHRFWRKGSSLSIWIAAAELTPPPGLMGETMGVMVCRKLPPSGKLTSTFLQRFGTSARHHIIHLDPPSIRRFLRREDVQVSVATVGYHIVFFDDRVLGAGFVRGGVLRSELPKAWTLGLTDTPPPQ